MSDRRINQRRHFDEASFNLRPEVPCHRCAKGGKTCCISESYQIPGKPRTSNSSKCWNCLLAADKCLSLEEVHRSKNEEWKGLRKEMFALARAEIPPNGDTLAPLEKLNKGLKEYISHTKVMKKIKRKFRLNDEYTATSTPYTSSAGAQGQQTAGAQDQEIAEAQDQETAEAQGQETAGFAGGDVPFMLDELDDEWNNLLNFNNTDFMAPGSG